MFYVYWLLKWLYILIIINFEPYSNAGYINQYLCPKGAWQEYLGISPVENKNDLELDFKVFFFTDSCCSDIVDDESR